MKLETIKSIIHNSDAFFSDLEETAFSEPRNIERVFAFLDQYVTFLKGLFNKETVTALENDTAALVLERIFIQYKSMMDFVASLEEGIDNDEYLAAYQTRLAEQGQAIEDNLSKTESLKTALQELMDNREKMGRQAAEIDALQKQLIELQTLKKRIDETDMVQLAKDIKALEAEIGNRNEEMDRLRGEKETIQKKHDELSEIRDLLRESLKTLKQKAAANDIDAREDLRAIDSLVKVISGTLRLEHDTTELDIARSIPQYETLWTDYEGRQKDYREIVNAIEKLQGILFLDKSALPESQASLNDLEHTLSGIEQRIRNNLQRIERDGKGLRKLNIQGVMVPEEGRQGV